MLARDYQTECHDALRNAFRKGKKRVLCELATGLGKTVLFSMIADMARAKGGKTLILCNRDKLIRQAADKYYKITRDIPATEQSELKASRMAKVVIGSIQSMQGKRLQAWAKDHFSIVICDEVHGAAAKSFRSTISHFDSAFHIGFSATIERADGQGVGWWYEDIVYRLGIMEGIERGWLVPLLFEKLPVPVTLDERLMKKKHLTEADEEFQLEPYVERLIASLSEKVSGKKALCFFPTCKPSEAAAQKLCDNGILAKHIDSTYMPDWETQQKLDWFDKSGSGTTLCNASLLGVGYDNPSIDLIAIVRLIRSTPYWTQLCGRGTRPVCAVDNYSKPELRRQAIAESSKPFCTILDLLIQGDNHNIAQPSCLISTLKEERKAIEEKMIRRGGSVTLDGMKSALQEKRVEDATEKLRKVAEDAANAAERVRKTHEVFIGDIIYGNSSGENASEKQMAFIKLMREIKINGRMLTKFQASKIIGRVLTHRDKLKQRQYDL